MKTMPLMISPAADASVSQTAHELSPWFHNLHLPDGTVTAPGHPLGDFPANKWKQIAPFIPPDLTGRTVLDIGCNAGFYSIELAKRGARVAAVDKEPHFLKQAAWAIKQFGLEQRIQLHQLQVYDLAHVEERFDIVLFMGLFYHLRYPTLALDIVAEKVTRLLLFQTMTMPGERVFRTAEDYAIDEREVMRKPGWPTMGFIEKSLAGDATNWWAPNHACVEALLRSTGMRMVRRVGHEVYLCAPASTRLVRARHWDEQELLAATGRSRTRTTILSTLSPKRAHRSPNSESEMHEPPSHNRRLPAALPRVSRRRL